MRETCHRGKGCFCLLCTTTRENNKMLSLFLPNTEFHHHGYHHWRDTLIKNKKKKRVKKGETLIKIN